MIAAYNNILPLNNAQALDELSTEIESGQTEDKVQTFKRRRLYPTSNFDPNDKHATDFSRAESAYLRMVHHGFDKPLPFANYSALEVKKSIVRIDFIENPEMEKTYVTQKDAFRQMKISDEEKLLFHGTDPSQIRNILANNFDLHAHPVGRPKKGVYGKG